MVVMPLFTVKMNEPRPEVLRLGVKVTMKSLLLDWVPDMGATVPLVVPEMVKVEPAPKALVYWLRSTVTEVGVPAVFLATKEFGWDFHAR